MSAESNHLATMLGNGELLAGFVGATVNALASNTKHVYLDCGVGVRITSIDFLPENANGSPDTDNAITGITRFDFGADTEDKMLIAPYYDGKRGFWRNLNFTGSQITVYGMK